MYSATKTIGKAAPPAILAILVPVIIALAKQAGITLDETTVYSIALAGYGAVIAFINWLKNHKKA